MSVTTRAAFGSILGLVANTATSVTNLVDSANVGVSKIRLYADDSLLEQRARSHANRQDLLLNIEQDVIKRRAELNMQMQQWKSQSTAHADAFAEAEAHYKDLFKDFKV